MFCGNLGRFSVIHFRPVHDSITDTCSSSLQKYNISFKRQNIWTGKWITENRPRFFQLQLTVEHSPIAQWIQQQLERNKKEHLVEEQKQSNRCGFHL